MADAGDGTAARCGDDLDNRYDWPEKIAKDRADPEFLRRLEERKIERFANWCTGCSGCSECKP